VQGFIIELGITSLYYTIALSIYYKLTIVDGWREERLKRNQKWFHGIPIFIGVASAAIGIPFYDITPFGCHLYPIPVGETYPWMIPLAYLPVIAATLFLSCTMAYIYWKVYSQDKAANKWRIKNRLGGKSKQQGISELHGSRFSGEVPGGASSRRWWSWITGWWTKRKRKKSNRSKLVDQVFGQGVACKCQCFEPLG